MKFVFNNNETVSISMQSYIEDAIKESHIDICNQAGTPATKGLLEADEDSPLLGKPEAELFHKIVAKLLWSTGYFVNNWIFVHSSGTTYRTGSVKVETSFGIFEMYHHPYINPIADDLNSIHTWVAASYVVHPDMKSHAGGLMSMGTGAILSKST
jgi:hypothetical protein